MKDQITIAGHDGAFAAYIARPKTVPAPAVIVLQELFGVNADIRKHCDELAEQGFLAVAPDLFWRQEPGVDLAVTSEADWQHGLRLYGAYDRDVGAKDVRDTVDAVRKLAPHLKMVHLKDVQASGGEVNVLLGKGIARIPEVMSELRKVNYGGLVAIEYEHEGSVEEDVRIEVEYARKLL